MALTIEEAEELLAASFAPWIQDLGLRFERVGAEGVAMRLPHSERLCRMGGLICGQALMAFADTCMVFTVAAAVGGFREMATASQNTSFFAPAIGQDVVAEGRALMTGRLLVFGEVAMRLAGDGRLVAKAASTYALPPPRG
jgi:acyl-coenzyme A thioesterase PaaI-like protein